MRLIKHETLTCGHKTVGVKWLFEHATSHQLFVTVDKYALRKPNRFIPLAVRLRKNISGCFSEIN
ncbi:MAG: hypothetical protein EOM44_15110 [Bacteroidia bacterium]|nr:hypothetical protein [Bacteroidia bacterium]